MTTKTRATRLKHIAFEAVLYILALGILLGIVLYVKWIFF